MIRYASDFATWRDAARELLAAEAPPQDVLWMDSADGQQPLFSSTDQQLVLKNQRVLLPRRFVESAQMAARHSSNTKWPLLYRIAWRIAAGERNLMAIETDEDVRALGSLTRQVEHDIYQMRQFVRFRRVEHPGGEQFAAWYRPQHRTLGANAKFFVDRFGGMRWAILTPAESLHWDLERLHVGPGVPASAAPSEDQLENLWRTYYSSIYNPARLNITAMRAQLPVGRWATLPEARVIAEAVRESRGRVQDMAARQPRSASEFVPKGGTLNVLRDAVKTCAACELCGSATQPVFGEGPSAARVMVVGEQPGDEEDRAGRPFLGPAGQVLDGLIAEAGLDRADLYVTNAVKAFRFEERGKRRIHQTPRGRDIAVCRPWLEAEAKALQPKLILCLGASAAQSVLGRSVQIGRERGQLQQHHWAPHALVTYHPSAILRTPDADAKRDLREQLLADLKLCSMVLEVGVEPT